MYSTLKDNYFLDAVLCFCVSCCETVVILMVIYKKVGPKKRILGKRTWDVPSSDFFSYYAYFKNIVFLKNAQLYILTSVYIN